jgi:DNA-binding beta-propeller fold protein YncE
MKWLTGLVVFFAIPGFSQLYLSELLFKPSGSNLTQEMIEIRGFPGSTIPENTYLVFVDANYGSLGDVRIVFDLSGRSLGQNGYLVLLQSSSFFSGGSSAANVIISPSQGWSGLPFFYADSGDSIDLTAFSCFLIRSTIQPQLTDVIDSDGNGHIDPEFANAWTVLDGISVADGTDAQPYGSFLFFDQQGNSVVPDGATQVITQHELGYVARILERTGHTSEDWVGASVVADGNQLRLMAGATYGPFHLDQYELKKVGSLNFPLWSQVRLKEQGSYRTGVFNQRAAVGNAFDPVSGHLFVINQYDNTVDVLDASDPQHLTLITKINSGNFGPRSDGLAVHQGLVAVLVDNHVAHLSGALAFYDVDGNFLNYVNVGAQPEMVAFTPDGLQVVVTNEGEANDAFTIDPVGSISIVDLSVGVASLGQQHVTTLSLSHFDGGPIDPNVRIIAPGATVGEDLEPERLVINAAGTQALVVCQENNAVVEVDLVNKTLLNLWGLGYKDHLDFENELDPSDRDAGYSPDTWPVWGMYQPDGVGLFSLFGQEILVTANEGASRVSSGFDEEARIGELVLDPVIFPEAAEMQVEEELGRLKVTTSTGNTDEDPEFEALYSFGGRSFSLWRSDGQQVYDSGGELEWLVAMEDRDHFNCAAEDNDSFDERSDDRGPEPEGLVIGDVAGRHMLFLGLSQVGGVVVVDLHNPFERVEFQQWKNTRVFSGSPELDTAGDLSPDGLTYVKAEQEEDPSLLFVSYEVSGSTTAFRVDTLGTALKAWASRVWTVSQLMDFAVREGPANSKGARLVK